MTAPIGKAVLLPALLVALAAPSAAQQCPDPAVFAQAVTPILAPVRVLADDAYDGRLAGTPAARCAGDYIADRFAALGLAPAGTDGFFQDVPLASVLNPHAAAATGRNVVALLAGTDPALREQLVIVGAHYDHLGHGEIGSLVPGDSTVHNGADDNASGVAAMLEVAARLAARPPARPILFIAFTGEESGLLGSAHWVREPTRPLGSARAMLNMDMVGRLDGRPLIVYGTGTAEEWPEILDAAGDAVGLELSHQPDGHGPSDHTSFYTHDIPVLHFFSNTHVDYHRPSDDWQKIDVAGLRRVTELVTHVVRDVAERRGALALVRGAGQPRTADGGSGYGAWLGTVPDFAPVERGVRLGGVTPGSPADLAGLKAGDILIGMAGTEIVDLQGMTDVLRAHRPGETVDLIILREGGQVTARATLGSRSERGG